MARSIRPLRVNHMNVVLQDFDASVALMGERYGGELMADFPQKEFHACLVEMGQVIFELFVPYDFLICARYGPHYLGLEWQADMDDVRAAVTEHNIRIVRDIGLALHTDPADCFGVSYEFYSGYFHDRDWPPLGGKIKSAEYWRDEHPLGLTGLKGYTHVVEDVEAASAFLQSFLGAEQVHDEARPAIAARAIGLRVADAAIELLTPVGEGAIWQHLHRHGQGIRSTVFGVRDIAQARRYFAERDVPLEPGSSEGSIAVPAAANLGLIFEFSE
jgi:catechol 2,3-dioxygenase-like lactoylglutathione lyase family enzyme